MDRRGTLVLASESTLFICCFMIWLHIYLIVAVLTEFLMVHIRKKKKKNLKLQNLERNSERKFWKHLVWKYFKSIKNAMSLTCLYVQMCSCMQSYMGEKDETGGSNFYQTPATSLISLMFLHTLTILDHCGSEFCNFFQRNVPFWDGLTRTVHEIPNVASP